MVNSYCSVFLVNLVQDVNILRPLIHMCAVDLKIPTEVMVSKKFVARDTTKSWQTEIRQLCAQVGAIYTVYESVYEARKWLENKSGYLVAGSESNLDAHDMTRDVFRSAPSAFTCVTLQHGYECVGMLQSKQHNIAHGEDVTFAADVVCGWFKNIDMMRSMSEHQKSKVWPAGPTSLLQQPNGESSEIESLNQGLICENLHSTRLNVSGDLKVAFIEQFSSFCEELKKRKKKVALRPHPGGQYTVKNKQHIPANVTLVNDPIYKVDLRAYSYGISAPSSVLIDMLLAQIPVAVW